METRQTIPFTPASLEPVPATARRRSDPTAAKQAARWWLLGVGPLLGLVLGMVARGWMRLLTTDPEFSWSGTIVIVVAFTLVGLGHAVASVARRGRRRWSTSGRLLGAFLTLPLFGGAGSIMLPTVVAGSLSLWHPRWPRSVRLLVAALAIPAPAFVTIDTVNAGLTPARTLGLVLMAATYTVVIWATRPIAAPVDDGWRLDRRLRGLLIGAIAVAGIAIVVGITGIAG